jgi:hypothetical protein
MTLAHVAGIPIEELLLSGLATLGGGLAVAVRGAFAARRRPNSGQAGVGNVDVDGPEAPAARLEVGHRDRR